MVTHTKHQTINGIEMDSLSDTAQAVKEDPKQGQCRFHIKNKWLDGGHNQSTITDFYAASHDIDHARIFLLDADEPPLLAGHDYGANPVEHLLNALAGCVTSSIIYHAALEGIEIEQLESEVEGDLDIRGFMGLSKSVRKGFQNIRIKFRIKTAEKNLDKLKKLSEFSPVFDTITRGTNVDIEIDRM